MNVYNLLIPEEYNDKSTGEIKTQWHRVGKAFSQEKGEGFDLVIPSGVSITGRVKMLPRDRSDGEE